MKTNKRWTADEERLLIKLHAQGDSIKLIAAKLARTPNAVTAKIYNIKKHTAKLTPIKHKEAPAQTEQITDYTSTLLAFVAGAMVAAALLRAFA